MPTVSIAEAYQLAVQFHQRGRLDEAEPIYRQILAIDPQHDRALHLLGMVAHQAGRPADAELLIRRAIALRGDQAEYHNNLGEILRVQDRLDEAVAAYRIAIHVQPAFALAHSNLGVVLMLQGALDEAEAVIRRAMQLRPNYVAAYFNLACVFERRGQFTEAVAAYRQALRLQPHLVDAHLNLGGLLLHLSHVEAAADCFRAILSFDPSSSSACTNLGNVAKDQGDLDEALSWYRRALQFDPGNHVAHSNVAYGLLFHPASDEAQILAIHREWDERHARPLERAAPAFSNGRDPARRLRVGYVSPNFSSHVVGQNLLPLFRLHDADRFEIFCYSDTRRDDATTAEFRQRAQHWRQCIGRKDATLAAQVEADRIDILVDLTLHMSQHRLLVFARRPAPVQVTFAGYPGTTGLRTIQYRLTDAFLDPPDIAGPYAEESMRLPSFWCFLPRGDEPEVGPLPMAERGHVTFGCLNNFCKVAPQTLALWGRVLARLPASRLVLLSAPCRNRARTLELLAHSGVAATRVEFVPPQSHRDYVATYQRIDVALDTLPYNGHSTSCDALWMGVPVVTLVGSTVVGRAGLSQLSNLGLPELIARSEDEFVDKAVALAGDPARLAGLRATLRARMQASPLMDAAGFTRAIESAYREMWQRWCASPAAGP